MSANLSLYFFLKGLEVSFFLLDLRPFQPQASISQILVGDWSEIFDSALIVLVSTLS